MKTNFLILFLVFSNIVFAQNDFYFESKQGEFVQVLNHGEEALVKRLELIAKAKKTIDIEYFIFEKDFAGKIVFLEILRAIKERNVKVRMLIDGASVVLRFDPLFYFQIQEELKDKKDLLEIKIYNQINIIPRVIDSQFRNHRKLLISDNMEAILGGRNIGVDYFHMDEKYNFHDKDVWVQGEVVKGMTKSFEAYFNHQVSKTLSTKYFVPAKKIKRINDRSLTENPAYKTYLEKIAVNKEFLTHYNLTELKKINKLKEVGLNQLQASQVGQCEKIVFATDAPGGNKKLLKNKIEYVNKFRFLSDEMTVFAKDANDRLIIISPYMISTKETRFILDKILESKRSIEVLTNSLNSTDAVYISAIFYSEVEKWRKKGLKVFLHSGNKLSNGNESFYDESIDDGRWGLHTKTLISENKENPTRSSFMIGSYNMDNRSYLYNSELGLFCYHSDLAKKLLDTYEDEKKQIALELISKNKAIDSKGKETNRFVDAGVVKWLMMRGIHPIAAMLRHLL